MSSYSIDELIKLLVQALREESERKKSISRFQQLVWDLKGPAPRGAIFEILRDLAHDLDYFEANPSVRRENASYYDTRRLEQEIRAALRKLRDAGARIPDDLELGDDTQ